MTQEQLEAYHEYTRKHGVNRGLYLLARIFLQPFFLVYFVANSVAINVFNRFTLRGKEWLNTAVLALVTADRRLIRRVSECGQPELARLVRPLAPGEH